MRRYIVNSPTVEPLTLIEAKHWLRVDHNDDDGLIISLIAAARERIEARTGRTLMAQLWRVVLDRWPADGRLALPIMPVLSVMSVRLLDANNNPASVASTLYSLEAGLEPAVLVVVNVPQPGRSRNGIEIDVVAGYGIAAADCPQPLRQAMRLLVAQAYGLRGPERAPEEFMSSAKDIEALLAPYRMLRIGKSLLEQAA
jgi:uncharacterized phiE125 gp8 family phage protein